VSAHGGPRIGRAAESAREWIGAAVMLAGAHVIRIGARFAGVDWRALSVATSGDFSLEVLRRCAS